MLSKKLFLASIVLIVLVSLPLISLVEASSEMWSRTYGGTRSDVAYALVETSDGGYALAGYTWSFGETNTNYIWLVKTDANGDMLWDRTYGKGIVHSLVETSEGGYALAGATTSFGAGNGDYWLVKTDVAGNMQWNRTYGGLKDEIAYSLVETSDGGYAIAGDTESFGAGGHDFWLVKTDAHGNMEWNRTYGGTGNEWGCSLVETSDGGYAIAGGSFLVKTDANGNMLWNQTYPVSAYVLVETSDGGYALAGNYGFAYSNRWKLVKTDEHGNMEWNQTTAGALFERADSLVATSDGGYAIAGGWLLVKTDRYGNTLWYRKYGGTGVDRFNSLVKTSDGGFAIAGCTESFGAGGYDFWLVKTDEYGCIPEIHPPYICVDSHQNKTYTTTSVSLNFTVNEETSWMGYSLDGQDNVTITENTLILTELADGSHNITVYATDTDGNMAASETIIFTITKEDETATSWITTAIAIVAVAAAVGAALLIIYTKTKKNRTKK